MVTTNVGEAGVEGAVGAPPPGQVVYLVPAPKQKINIKERYAAKVATKLGVLHLLCAVVAFIADLCSTVEGVQGRYWGPRALGTGIWTSIFFAVSGSLAIAGARSASKCLVVATLVMSILSTVCAATLLIHSSILVDSTSDSSTRKYGPRTSPYYGGPVVCVLVGVVMLVVGVLSSSLTCRPLGRCSCCSSSQPAILYTTTTTLPQGLLLPSHQVRAGSGDQGKKIIPRLAFL